MKFVFEPWMIWSLCILGYIICSIVTSFILIKIDDLENEDPADQVLAGLVGLMWPMFLAFFSIAAPFWAIGKAASFLSERIK